MLPGKHQGRGRPGPGLNVATATFMVAVDSPWPRCRGCTCRDALSWAREDGCAGMQFNAVVESNLSAVELYQRKVFRIIGGSTSTLPRMRW